MTQTLIGYARCSTDRQDLSAQRQALQDLGVSPDHIYTDHGLTGTSRARPGLSEIIDHARPGDSLCVTRLGRSLKELLETVENLKAHDIHLVSLEERIDTTSAAGELVFHVFGAIAHFERQLISERTRDGIAAATRPGDRLSRANPCRGWLDAGTGREQLGIGRATAYRTTNAAR